MTLQQTRDQEEKQLSRASSRKISLEKFLTLIIFGQFAMIIILLAALSSEYQSSDTYKSWIDSNLAPLGFFLNYYIAPLIGIFVTVITFVFWKHIAPVIRLK